MKNNSKLIDQAMEVLQRLEPVPQVPDLSVLSDADLRSIAAMQDRLKAAGLPLVPDNLTSDELAVYTAITAKLS